MNYMTKGTVKWFTPRWQHFVHVALSEAPRVFTVRTYRALAIIQKGPMNMSGTSFAVAGL
jgi:hypothetical protein